MIGRSFIVSFFLHLIIFSAFIFVLPARFNFPKPMFVFLGPILKSQNIVGLGAKGKKAKINVSLRKFVYGVQEKRAFSVMGVDKKWAQASKEFIDPPKRSLKSFFGMNGQTQHSLKDNRKSDLKDIGVDMDTTPYHPLKFNSP